jgi:orotate phosphoribosyltransferase-like protein
MDVSLVHRGGRTFRIEQTDTGWAVSERGEDDAGIQVDLNADWTFLGERATRLEAIELIDDTLANQ